MRLNEMLRGAWLDRMGFRFVFLFCAFEMWDKSAAVLAFHSYFFDPVWFGS